MPDICVFTSFGGKVTILFDRFDFDVVEPSLCLVFDVVATLPHVDAVVEVFVVSLPSTGVTCVVCVLRVFSISSTCVDELMPIGDESWSVSIDDKSSVSYS